MAPSKPERRPRREPFCRPQRGRSASPGRRAYDDCAVREVREEIGLTLAQTPERLFKIDACLETGWEFCWIYRCTSEGPFTLHPEEIETGAWFAPEAVTKWVSEKPRDFASAFVLLWNIFISRKGAKTPSS